MILFCNTKEDGEIRGSLKGEFVVPDRQYEFFFYLDKEADANKIENLDEYKVDVATRQLVPREAE